MHAKQLNIPTALRLVAYFGGKSLPTSTIKIGYMFSHKHFTLTELVWKAIAG